jgi:hypothetical protein
MLILFNFIGLISSQICLNPKNQQVMKANEGFGPFLIESSSEKLDSRKKTDEDYMKNVYVADKAALYRIKPGQETISNEFSFNSADSGFGEILDMRWVTQSSKLKVLTLIRRVSETKIEHSIFTISSKNLNHKKG